MTPCKENEEPIIGELIFKKKSYEDFKTVGLWKLKKNPGNELVKQKELLR